MAYINTSSTVKLQEIINNAKSFADIEPVVNVAGSSVQRSRLRNIVDVIKSPLVGSV